MSNTDNKVVFGNAVEFAGPGLPSTLPAVEAVMKDTFSRPDTEKLTREWSLQQAEQIIVARNKAAEKKP